VGTVVNEVSLILVFADPNTMKIQYVNPHLIG
jgi:hypothetical protein